MWGSLFYRWDVIPPFDTAATRIASYHHNNTTVFLCIQSFQRILQQVDDYKNQKVWRSE